MTYVCLLVQKSKRIYVKRRSLVESIGRKYKKVLEMPIALNLETLAIFKETVNPKDVTYENRLKKWLTEV